MFRSSSLFLALASALILIIGCGGSVGTSAVPVSTPTATSGGGSSATPTPSPTPTPTPAPAPTPTPSPAPAPTPSPGVTPTPIAGVPTPPPAGSPPLCAVTYQQLDVPSQTSTSINGVNDSGTMVGSFEDKNGISHGFIYSNGQFTTVDGPNAVQNTTSGGPNGTELAAISSNGIIAGDQRTISPGAAGTYAQAFTYQNGKFNTFDEQASNAIPTGVNASGVVVGVGDLVGCCNVSWIHNPDGSNANFYETNGMDSGSPQGINDAGHIVGDAGPFVFIPNFVPPPYPNPTTSKNGTFTHFTVTGVSNPTTQGINSTDQVVGTFNPANSLAFYGWMKSGNNYCSLSVPGAKNTFAADLNDGDLIVGSYIDANGNRHGFVAH